MALKGSGCRENFIEVKSSAKQWDAEIFKKCQDAIENLTPGKVAVLCDKHIEEQNGILVAPGYFKGSQDSDTGTVLHSRYRHLKAGDRVGFLPMHGMRCSQPEDSWVPEGCEIRFYGMACPVNDSLTLLSS